jgi:glycosyltransferase involved in cell wall biosynthesis
MNSETKVSVVIPNYNSSKTILLCLEALVNQSHNNLEILLIDDGSTDQCLALAEPFGIQILHTGVNAGPSKARNMGAKAATGEVIFFLDSDVALFPEAIANTLVAFNSDASLGSVCGIYDKVPLIRDSLVEDYRSLQAYHWRKSSEGIVTPGFFSLGAVKTSVFCDIGGFNEALRDSEDAEYGHRLSQKYQLLLTSKVMGRHDDDDQVTTIMRKLFNRARTRVPLYFSRGKPMKGFETPARALALAFAAGVFMALPLVFLTSVFSLLPLLSLVIFMALDWPQYVFVYGEKGLAFSIFFTLVHLLVSATAFAGLLKGIFDWCIDPTFRREGVLL